MTRLGDDKKLRRGGRYARLMGNAWRHKKREKIGFAANGLLSDIWSWCADQNTAVLTKKGLRGIIAGEPNGPRMVKQLVEAGYLVPVADGHAVHDRDDYTPVHEPLGGPAEAADERTEDDPVMLGVTSSVMPTVMLGVMPSVSDAASEIINETTTPRAGASPNPQIPDPIPEREREQQQSAAAAVALQRVAADLDPDNQQTEPSDAAAPPVELEPEEPAQPEPPPPAEFSEREQRSTFVNEFERVAETYPNLGGRQVGDFHATVLRTARLQHRDPRELYAQALARWLSTPLDRDAQRFPYAFFCAAWGELTSTAPVRAPPTTGTHRRIAPSKATTAKDFEHEPDFEHSMRIIRGEAGA